MTLCKTLFNQEQEWRKHSVYPLRDDSDRDFEFYVFVDAGNEEKRPPFLQEVHHVLMGKQGFAVQSHEEELKRWLGEKAPSDMINPLNWIKIAIERYPYRLFVVINPKNWQSGNKSPIDAAFWQSDLQFLKKRICWVDQGQAQLSTSGVPTVNKCHDFLLNLYALWVRHIVREVQGLSNIQKLYLVFYRLGEQVEATTLLPDTLPRCLGGLQGNQITEEIRIMCLNLDDANIETKQLLTLTLTEKDFLLFFGRHKEGNLFSCNENDGWKQNQDIPFGWAQYSSISLTGVFSYYLHLMQALREPRDFSKSWFLYALAEQAVLRVGIVDERFQERIELNKNLALSACQSRILSVFWEDASKWGQRSMPAHVPCGKFIPSSSEVEISVDSNLWKEDWRAIDLMIIHQGILDKFFEKAEGAKNRCYVDTKLLEWKQEVPFILVTSGRGIPENLPLGAKFVPFSGLERCIWSSSIDKYLLVHQCFSTVRSGGEE